MIGTLGFVRKDKCGVLKKFFVAAAYRGKEIGLNGAAALEKEPRRISSPDGAGNGICPPR